MEKTLYGFNMMMCDDLRLTWIIIPSMAGGCIKRGRCLGHKLKTFVILPQGGTAITIKRLYFVKVLAFLIKLEY